ncbi:MAG: hypothetical protein R3F13_16635 [Prosthecobacter sp.]
MSIANSIHTLLGTSPSDLIAYFEKGVFHVNPETDIKCLSFEKALEYSQAIHKRTIIGKSLGLFALDDAGDSNPYCYVTHGPCAGAVLHLHHDDASTIDFASLDHFIAALTSLPDSAWIDELKPEPSLVFATQSELDRLLTESDENKDVFSAIYLPVTRDISNSLKASLVTNDDFFVREAFANWLLQHGQSGDLQFAEQLSKDMFNQVASPASAALNRIKLSGPPQLS